MLKSFFSFSAITFISRILGLLRDWFYAYFFGASMAMDAFLIAFKIPNFFRRLFAEGAFTQAFVPSLINIRQQSDNKNAEYQEFINGVFSRLFLTLLGLSLLGVVAAPIWVLLFAPGYVASSQQWDLTSLLLRFTFPYILLISLSAFTVAILNSLNRYAMGAFLPIILNVVLIIAASLISPLLDKPILALAIGVLVAGALQCCFILLYARSHGVSLRLHWTLSKAVKQHLKKMWIILIPALISVSVVQINLIVDMVLASTLTNGSITWLYFSQRLMELPNGIFVVALSTIVLTSFAELTSKKSWQLLSEAVYRALLLGSIMTLPAIIGLVILAEPIITILFEYGEFSTKARTQSALALQAYAVGLFGFMVIKVLVSAAFANKDSKTPLICAVIAVIVNIVLSLLLISLLAHVGLAIATTISALVNGGFLLLLLYRQGLLRKFSLWQDLSLILMLNLMFALLLLFINHYWLAEWLVLERIWQIFSLLLLIAMFAIGYAISLWLTQVSVFKLLLNK